MRMARVNITVPDDVLRGARTAHLNVSRIAASALSEELSRRAKIAALDIYLHELEVQMGPVGEDEQLAARGWADRVLAAPETQVSGAAGAAKTA
jgi:hypothetical protein